MPLFRSDCCSLLFIAFLCVLCQSQDCQQSQSCQSSTIISNNGSEIDCSGYKACYESVKLAGSEHISCYGSFSCYNSQLIQHPLETGKTNIRCHGLFSCSEVDLIFQSNGYLLCYGDQSCFNSELINAGTDGHTDCYGYRSCASSQITVFSSEITAFYAALSAQNSFVHGNSSALQASASTVIYFDGHQSAYNTHLTCSGTCEVVCFGSACNNLNISSSCSLITASDQFKNSSCRINMICTDAFQSDACPDGFTLSPTVSFPSLVDTVLSTIANSEQTCDNSVTNTGITCDDFQDSDCYNNGAISSAKQPGPICCRGGNACESSSSIEAVVSSNKQNDDTIAFRADAFESAKHTHGAITAAYGGSLYFTGASANFDSTSSVTGNGAYDVVVTGYRGISNQQVQYVRNVYCLSYFSCSRASISHVTGNVYAYARRALALGGSTRSSVTDVSGSVFCDGNGACLAAAMSGIAGDALGVGEYIMSEAIISDVAGTVLAYGFHALFGAHIWNVSTLEVDGVEPLDGSVVVSGGPSGGMFVAVLQGTSAANYDIYCNETDLCEIGCMSEQICENLQLHCIGTCYIDCDSGFLCPTISGSGVWQNFNLTFSPTPKPTSVPVALQDSSEESSEYSSSKRKHASDLVAGLVIVLIVLVSLFCVVFVCFVSLALLGVWAPQALVGWRDVKVPRVRAPQVVAKQVQKVQQVRADRAAKKRKDKHVHGSKAKAAAQAKAAKAAKRAQCGKSGKNGKNGNGGKIGKVGKSVKRLGKKKKDMVRMDDASDSEELLNEETESTPAATALQGGNEPGQDREESVDNLLRRNDTATHVESSG